MKKNQIISLLTLALIVSSCESMYEEKYIAQWDDETVWNNGNIVPWLVSDLYIGIPHRPDTYDSNFLDVATDNAMTNYTGSTMSDMANGNYSAVSNPLDCWETNYGYMQMASYYLDNGMNENLVFSATSADTDTGTRYRLMGEAYFMRAYYAFDLLQFYGGKGTSGTALGIPLLDGYTNTDTAADMLATYARSSYAECIESINGDLDRAIYCLGLPLAKAVAVTGRVDLNTAYALKSRVALFAASPAYQDDSVIKINSMGDFSVLDSDTYVENWRAAAGTTYEMMNNTGYTFYKLEASNLADASSTTPSEFIFRFYFNNRTMETAHYLPRYFGTAYTVPSQNLVDAFPMANGYPITDYRSGYDPSNPYEGRDSRFYLNVYYHGAWFGSESYADDDSPLTQIDILPGGADSRDGTLNASKNSYASKTGYYLAKFMSKNFDLNNPMGTSNAIHYWAEHRRTELFLNYAEAANEAWGPDVKGYYYDENEDVVNVDYSAYDIIKQIRSKSGEITGDDPYLLEVATKGKDAMRELIQNERRIELAFENHRFFDMRRCLLDLSTPIYGVEATLGYDGVSVNYNTTVVADDRSNLSNTRYYYFPLPYDEIVKGLEPNMGWE